MNRPGNRALLPLAVIGCLAWAGVEARHLSGAPRRSAPCATRAPEAAAVEASYAAIRAALDQGRDAEAVLSLRERTARGPYPGYAWFLLGEAAYREG
ncbi:MAG: hypothetical protein IH608_08160, partial [Proteobacteria bacterium]|nr:hypothetical protein [Pseudomonadota bacterium]